MRKSNLLSFQSLSSVSMTSNITSSATNIAYLDNIGVQFNFTGAPVGTFKIEVSTDYNEDTQKNIINPGSWTPLTLSPAPTAAASASTIYIDMNQLSAPWIRSGYTASSGSGVLSAFVTGKMV
jgi:hypothetical protein